MNQRFPELISPLLAQLLRRIATVVSRALKYVLDLWFDISHGVHTRGHVGTFAGRWPGTAYEHAQPYESSRRRISYRSIEALPIAHCDFTFVDLGSGKGKALVMAATIGFNRVIGVELAEELHRSAVANATKFAQRLPLATRIEPVHISASEFDFPSEPLVCYMYNPFDRQLVEVVMANLRESLRRTPRPAFVVYFNPVWGQVLRQAEWLKPLHESGLVALPLGAFGGHGPLADLLNLYVAYEAIPDTHDGLNAARASLRP